MMSGGHAALLIFGLVLLATSGESLAISRELEENREDSPTENLSRSNKRRNILRVISFNVDLQRGCSIERRFIRRR